MEDTFDQIVAIAPQMGVYDEMAGLQYWLPYVKCVTLPMIRTNVCNTDRYGLRQTTLPDGAVLDLDRRGDGPFSIVFGGSAVFGVGATSDRTTIPSALNRMTDRTWMNFGVRGTMLTQSLIHFSLHQRLTTPVEDLVLMIGMNELMAFSYALIYPENYGTFVNFTYYMDAVNPGYNDVENQQVTFPTNFLDAGTFHTIQNPQQQRHLLVEQTRSCLQSFAYLAQGMGARLSVAMQPGIRWHDHHETAEERELLTLVPHLQRQPDLVSRLADHYHNWWREAFADIAGDLGIPYVDLNQRMNEDPAAEGWLFIDDCHLTDKGNELCAGYIRDLVSS